MNYLETEKENNCNLFKFIIIYLYCNLFISQSLALLSSRILTFIIANLYNVDRLYLYLKQ